MLQLVLGRAGSGKTEYVFSSIKERVEKGEKDILLIVPEQFSFAAEKRLLSDLGEEKFGCVKCTSFTLLAKEHLFNDLPVLSKGSKAVMMKQAIEAVSDSLLLFNKNASSVSFINSVIKIYDEMKSCRVSAEDIIEASDNTEKELLSKKLKDIALIISAYDALIKNEYYDSANDLTRLFEKLSGENCFENRTVFVDGFNGFVAQEYKVIEVILSQAKEVFITFCSDSYMNNDEYDLFSYVNRNIRILKDIYSFNINDSIILKDNKRAKNSALSNIEKYAFANKKEAFSEAPDSVEIYNAKNLSDECDYIASSVSKLMRKGYKASEIAVICRDLDKYQKELNASFNKFNVPYFDDERQDINSQPLIMFVCFLLRIFIFSFRSEDIFSLLKTGLTQLDDNSINELENYAFLWSINGSKWKNEFTQSTKGFVDELTENDKKKLSEINKSREYVISRLLKFQKRAKNGSAKDICKAVYFALEDFSADKKLKELAIDLDKNGKSALALEQGRIWDLLIEILNKLAETCNDVAINIKEFYKLFSLMIKNEDLGSVPIGLDNVQFGSADRIRCENPRAVFVAGAVEGEFPQSVTSSGLLSENDRITLIKNDFKLYSYGETLNAQERYFAYMAVSSPSEKLFVSFIGNDTESAIVRGIKSVYPALEYKHYSDELTLDKLESKDNSFELLASNYSADDEFVSSLEKYFEGEEEYKPRLSAIRKLYENNEIELYCKDVARSLFGNDMYLSASRIEDYYNCAFRYFCKFGLNAWPRVKAQMDPLQTGTVIHYVLEQVVKDDAFNSENTALLVNKYLENYLNFKMGDSEQFTPRFKYQFMRLSRMLVNVIERLKAEFEQSDFTAKAFELKIGNGSDDESVRSEKIMLPDGGSIEIKGAVDRVDVYTEGDKQYIRVVDYKSGKKEFLFSDILYGLNLQMFIYLFALSKSQGEYSGISSGVLYMHSSRNHFLLDRNASFEKLASKEDELFKMKGVVLNDKENQIAKHMEHDLSGKFIPVKYVKKNDEIVGNIVTLEELGRISRKIDMLIENMGTSLHGGRISQNPVNGKNHDKTCDFCDYKAVCLNRREVNHKEIENLEKDKVMEIIKEETDA